MKTTYLMNQEQPDGSVALTAVSSAEWLDAVRPNKCLPAEQQRHFIIDYIADGDDLDRMVIEAPIEEYRKWHREHMASERNRQIGKNMQKLSIDMRLFGMEDVESLQDVLSSGEDMEKSVYDQMLLDDLRRELAAWKPWGNDLLDFYLEGQTRECTDFLSEKYGVSPQVIRKYKRQFENFIKNFLRGVSF